MHFLCERAYTICGISLRACFDRSFSNACLRHFQQEIVQSEGSQKQDIILVCVQLFLISAPDTLPYIAINTHPDSSDLVSYTQYHCGYCGWSTVEGTIYKGT